MALRMHTKSSLSLTPKYYSEEPSVGQRSSTLLHCPEQFDTALMQIIKEQEHQLFTYSKLD
jgi:hypothetical protein